MPQDALQVEPVCVLLAGYLGQDELVVIVPESASHLVVVHVGAILSLAPATGHLLWVQHAELPNAVLPADAHGVGLGVS